MVAVNWLPHLKCACEVCGYGDGYYTKYLILNANIFSAICIHNYIRSPVPHPHVSLRMIHLHQVTWIKGLIHGIWINLEAFFLLFISRSSHQWVSEYELLCFSFTWKGSDTPNCVLCLESTSNFPSSYAYISNISELLTFLTKTHMKAIF